MRLAYQGEPGAYSEAAALLFSPHAETLPCKTFDEVFSAVMRNRATHGVLPMENSIGGTIHRNYDLLVDHEIAITGEVELDAGGLGQPQVAPFPDHPGAALAGVNSHGVVAVVAHFRITFIRGFDVSANAAVPDQVHIQAQQGTHGLLAAYFRPMHLEQLPRLRA